MKQIYVLCVGKRMQVQKCVCVCVNDVSFVGQRCTRFHLNAIRVTGLSVAALTQFSHKLVCSQPP